MVTTTKNSYRIYTRGNEKIKYFNTKKNQLRTKEESNAGTEAQKIAKHMWRTNHEMTEATPFLLMTLNINELNSPIKRQNK